MNPVALRKDKNVYNFGLSECKRVTRKTFVLSKDIKIIHFCNTFLFFEQSKVSTCICSLRKKSTLLFQAATGIAHIFYLALLYVQPIMGLHVILYSS